MKILVTGSNGQLGSELRNLCAGHPDFSFIFTDEKELDITNQTNINEFFAANNPEIIINCAAFTAVDKAETEEKAAFLINSKAVAYLSKASSKFGALIIHISTDYVFDGKACLPYSETNKTKPLSIYGKSKNKGEESVRKYAKNAVIIRTSWLYSEYGNNFVKTILKYSRERDFLNIVSDQIGSPTYARDLAKMILKVIPLVQNTNGVEIFHYSNEGVASWYDFAKAIMDNSGIECSINAIKSANYPQLAQRPFYSVLDKSKLKERFSIQVPYWRDSLKECMQQLVEK